MISYLMHVYHIYMFALFVLYYVNVICMVFTRTFIPAAFAWWLQRSFLDGNETIKDQNVVAAGTEQYESLTERMIEKKTVTQQTLTLFQLFGSVQGSVCALVVLQKAHGRSAWNWNANK